VAVLRDCIYHFGLIVAVSLPLISHAQINNGIFNGSSNDGHDISTFGQPANSLTFAGGIADGHIASRFTQAINSNLFSGGTTDGHDLSSFTQAINSAIFAGGNADGHDLISYVQSANSSIFAGGIADGYDLVSFMQATNSGIFSGGVEDGHDQTSFTQNINSEIFAGGNDDGFTIACSSLEAPPCTSLVTSLADSGPGTLRSAIGCANIGDTIKFNPDLGNAIIVLESTIVLSKDVSIYADPDNVITLSAEDIDVAIMLNTTFISYWKGLHILTGNAVIGGGIINHGTLTLEDILVESGQGAPTSQVAVRNNGDLNVMSNVDIIK